MSREIKFRAWDNKIKRMIYPEGVLEASNEEGYVHLEQTLSEIDSDWRLNYIDENSILLQFTGLKDKNGKEIYEGDIVKLYNHHQVEEVEYIGSAFGVMQHNDNKRDFGVSENLDEWAPNGIEVIGNKFENPELLK